MATRSVFRLFSCFVRVFAPLALVFCGLAQAAFPVRVTDDKGRSIELTKPPQRIVVLGPVLYAYMVVDLGASARVLGVTQSPDLPPELARAQSLGHPFSPDLERVLALSPDLVLGGTEAVEKQLVALSIPCFGAGLSSLSGSEQMFGRLRAVGQLLYGDPAQADRLIHKIQAEMSSVETKLAGFPRLRVAVLYAGPRGALYAAGNDTPEHELLVRSVGQNVFGHLARHKPVSAEELLRQRPEVILIDQNQLRYLTELQALHTLPAMRDGRVFGLRGEVLSSARLGLALRSYAERIHPRSVLP